ncbi:MAG: biotin/lipoyl-containing protein, partial [Anaerovoracaceae bacterium]
MKKYNIKVNGTAYEVEVEEMGGAASAAPAPVAAPAAVATPAIAAAPTQAAAVASAPSAGAESITAPMPGTILDVKVTAGAQVAAGDILLILEAMKMENEILAPRAGTVDTVP